MTTEFENVKQAIVDAQLASTPRDQIAHEITNGMANLLSAHDIIKRLGITANEFQELVNLPNHYLQTTGGVLGVSRHNTERLFEARIELINKDLEGKSTFPKPDFYLLGKARWKKETFKKWLAEQGV